MTRPLRLLTLGHPYAISTHRALAAALAEAGGAAWEVTCAAPLRFPGGAGAEELARERVEAVRVYGTRRMRTFRYGLGVRSLLARGWDVVHCREEPSFLAGAQVAAWTPPDARLVFSTLQRGDARHPLPFRLAERYALRRASGWIASGEEARTALAARAPYLGLPYRALPFGVDTRRFRPDPAAGAELRRRLGWEEEGPPVIGFLGRFVPEKGVDTLVNALERVRTPWRALIVGGGVMEEALRMWGGGREARVRVVSGVPHEAVPAFLNAMDLLCVPTRAVPGPRATLGRSLMEGMACGVPVASSDAEVLPRFLGEGGAILPVGDVEAWARGIEGLLADPGRRAALGLRGIARVRAELGLDVVARRHLEFFAELAGR